MTIDNNDFLDVPVFFRCGAAVSRVEEVQQHNIARASTPRKVSQESQLNGLNLTHPAASNVYLPLPCLKIRSGKVTGCQHVGCLWM